jgi:hypothetical protein
MNISYFKISLINFFLRNRLDLDLNRYSYIEPLGTTSKKRKLQWFPIEVHTVVFVIGDRVGHCLELLHQQQRSIPRKKLEADTQTDEETPLFWKAFSCTSSILTWAWIVERTARRRLIAVTSPMRLGSDAFFLAAQLQSTNHEPTKGKQKHQPLSLSWWTLYLTRQYPRKTRSSLGAPWPSQDIPRRDKSTDLFLPGNLNYY